MRTVFRGIPGIAFSMVAVQYNVSFYSSWLDTQSNILTMTVQLTYVIMGTNGTILRYILDGCPYHEQYKLYGEQ